MASAIVPGPAYKREKTINCCHNEVRKKLVMTARMNLCNNAITSSHAFLHFSDKSLDLNKNKEKIIEGCQCTYMRL